MIRSSFFEFNVATSALYTARGNIQISGHNVANAGTDGYSRQYGIQTATTPLSGYGSGMYGTGSQIISINQYRSFFLDVKYWNHTSTLGENTAKSEQLTLLETTLNEMGDTGLKTSLNDFFDTLQDLSSNVGDSTYRNNVLTSADSILSLVNSMGTKIVEQQSDINQEIKTMTETINSYGNQIASLNEQIRLYELQGDNANDLRDQRANIVDELSKLVNVSVEEKQRNKDYNADDNTGGANMMEYSVKINGMEFVKGNDVNTLYVKERKDNSDGTYNGKGAYDMNEMDAQGMYDIYFSDANTKLNLYSSTLEGELKGLIDMRDGNNGMETMYVNKATGEVSSINDGVYDASNSDHKLMETSTYKGLPHYMNKLNEFVRTFARAFNEGTDSEGEAIPNTTGHINAYDSNGNKGEYLFTYAEEGSKSEYTTVDSSFDYNNMNFLNISLNDNIQKDSSKFALYSSELADKDDTTIVSGYIGIKDYNSLFREGKLEDYVISMTSDIGVTLKQANTFTSNYEELVTTTDNQRISVMGVDINEEMVRLTQNQQIFQAASQLISTIDTIYNTLINVVGA